ncbi:MAG: radical SAM protein, partial [Acidobacteriia bacterium]|nr:radical SAM protein [Terriglobia bacterium]
RTERDEIAPPLGLLSLARVAQHVGTSVAIEDLNLMYHIVPRLQTAFYETALERLLALSGDVYGFTSMAVDSHVALELARRLKSVRPDVRIVLGGPHFSSISKEVRERFSWVDNVISGEGERGFSALLGEKDLGNAGGELVGTDTYSLVQCAAYFKVNPTRTADFEVGRGCRYKCTFCYSPKFYEGVRNYSIEQIVERFAGLKKIGFERVFVVNDNLLNDREWALGLCRALEEARLGLTWSCYVTLPDLTEEVARRLGRAGCRQVFMGVDVVGRTSETTFHKRFLPRNVQFDRKLKALTDAGVRPTCGFILAPASHPASVDVDATLSAALEARLNGADVVINALSLYPGTAAYHPETPVAADPLQVQLLMDVPSIVEHNHLAGAVPHLFPFHSRYTSESEWREFMFFCHAAHTLVNSFPEAIQSVSSERSVRPSGLLREVSRMSGDLMRLLPAERRPAEQQAALELLTQAAPGDVSPSDPLKAGGAGDALPCQGIRQTSW